MSTPDWLNRSVSRFVAEKKVKNTLVAQENIGPSAIKKIVNGAASEVQPSGRSTRERLTAITEFGLAPTIYDFSGHPRVLRVRKM